MAGLRTDKYIVTEQPPEWAGKEARGLFLNDGIIKGSFFLQSFWISKPAKQPTPDGTTSHTHDADEIIAFFGSDPSNWRDLGGEVEMWLDGEQHLLTKTCLIFIPKGLKHCPLIVRRVDRPIFHFSTGPALKYTRQNETVV